MTNIQEWLDIKYSVPQNKEQVKEIIINSNNPKKDISGGKLTIKDYPNLEKLEIWGKYLKSPLTELEISNCPDLEEINCCNNELTSLVLGKLENLTDLNCFNNQLIELDVNNCPNLKNFHCSNNALTSLDLSENEKLEKLNISNNNFLEQDLSFLSHLVNLEYLRLENTDQEKIRQGIYNRFVGSLKPLKNMSKSEEFDIRNTDIDSGLEYLPENLNSFLCWAKKRPQARVKKIHEELFLYGGNLRVWKEAYLKLVEVGEVNSYSKLTLLPAVPVQLLDEKKSKLEENYDIGEISYQEITLRDNRPFSWEIKQDKSLLVKELPIKLYNNKLDQVEWTRNSTNIKNYATLSYVWGKPGTISNTSVSNTQYKDKLNPMGYKVLYKAVKACEHLGINYLWMDQLCINQDNIEEKNQEVSKMKQYYNNAEVTLIAISTNAPIKENKKELVEAILKKVVSSEWFTRSWTYQEGLLSKQTIFMFDNALIDGRMLAQVWGLFHSKVIDYQYAEDYCYKNLNEKPEIFITPLGWTYSKQKNDLESQPNLGLSQSLVAIKDRGRGVPIDGIYSILGLLPYGNQVKPRYKAWGHQYSKEELEEVLMEVMKIAIQNGYFEPLTWFGSRKSESGEWWIPQIDENGSTNVMGGTSIRYEPKNAKLTKNGIELSGYKYIIDHLRSDGRIYPIDENLGEIWVGTTDGNFFGFWGVREILEKVKPSDFLIIPNEEQWKSDKDFAILIPGKDNLNCPVNVVDLISGHVKKKVKVQELFIDVVSKKVVELKESQANWKNYGQPFLNFTEVITQEWIQRGFNQESCKEWLDIGLKFQDAEYAQWLRNEVKTTPEKILSESNEAELRELFQEYQQLQQEQFQAQIQVIPYLKNN